MLTLFGVTKSYGDRVLFADAALQVNRGDRIGLVGPNGAGKSTLFSLILKEEPADDGRINLERDAKIGYLPQESAPVGDETVVEIACAVSNDFVALRRIIKAWENDHPVEAQHPELVHDDVHDRYNELNGYYVEAKAKPPATSSIFCEAPTSEARAPAMGRLLAPPGSAKPRPRRTVAPSSGVVFRGPSAP